MSETSCCIVLFRLSRLLRGGARHLLLIFNFNFIFTSSISFHFFFVCFLSLSFFSVIALSTLITALCSIFVPWFCDHRDELVSLGGRIGTDTGCAGCWMSTDRKKKTIYCEEHTPCMIGTSKYTSKEHDNETKGREKQVPVLPASAMGHNKACIIGCFHPWRTWDTITIIIKRRQLWDRGFHRNSYLQAAWHTSIARTTCSMWPDQEC